MNDHAPEDALISRQIAEALSFSDFDRLSDHELEQMLDSTVPDSLSETNREAILRKTQQLVQQGEDPAMHQQRPLAVSIGAKRKTFEPAPETSAGKSVRPRRQRNGSGLMIVLAGVALLAFAFLLLPSGPDENETAQDSIDETIAPTPRVLQDALHPASKPAAPLMEKVAVGSVIETGARERKRATLPDGSVLYLNENTQAVVESARKIRVAAGEVFVEVVPKDLIPSNTPFVVETPNRSVTALGTKFLVKAGKRETDVLVTQGKVKVSDQKEPVTAGQLLEKNTRRPAPRASQALLWTKELMAAAESPLVPKSEHAGGALVAVDPHGQEMKLSLRKQHIDVHIEDGFARTTIDQTYFNASWSRMEGTFYFPLPADASLSRLAMYVGENLMEGGMAERNHARNVFEQIRYTRRDPALLEWVDGSTFKMRVFPLEPRQEKRIVISFTQRLSSAYGKVHYRFPAGHSLELIRDWSTQILVKGHGMRKWSSPSHELESRVADGDLILENTTRGLVDDKDLVIELEDAIEEAPNGNAARFSRVVHQGQQYLMLRYRPDLHGELKRKPRNWVFLFESAGNRDALLARVQIDVLSTLLKNSEHADTFSIVTAGTRAKVWQKKPVAATPKNIKQAIEYLNNVHLIGALNLENALEASKPFLKPQPKNADAEQTLVHLGAGVAVLGEKDTPDLLRKLPEGIQYVGVGVGKRWSQGFMKAAANQTGGHVTQINPDELVSWRAFELLSLLNAPRVLNVRVLDPEEKHSFLQFSETLAQGEELCAITRIDEKTELPKSLLIAGKLSGQPYEKTIPVADIQEEAAYLPRTWAKLEIDRLVAKGAEQNKEKIIKLSKAMYVMSPFTSLLVLENEEMYAQFKVDRGRKDHWALYPCPPKIPVVYEPGNKPVQPVVSTIKRAKTAEDLLKTILIRTPPVAGTNVIFHGLNALQVYTGAIAGPVRMPAHHTYWGLVTPTIALDDSLSFSIPQPAGFMNGVLEGGANHFVYPVGDMVMNSYMGNLWFDSSMEGVSNTNMLEGIPQSGPVIMDWSGAATWNRPQLGNFSGNVTAWPSYGLTAVNGSAVTYSDFYFSRDGQQFAGQPFYPYPQVPLGWRKAQLNWDDGAWAYRPANISRSYSTLGDSSVRWGRDFNGRQFYGEGFDWGGGMGDGGFGGPGFGGGGFGSGGFGDARFGAFRGVGGDGRGGMIAGGDVSFEQRMLGTQFYERSFDDLNVEFMIPQIELQIRDLNATLEAIPIRKEIVGLGLERRYSKYAKGFVPLTNDTNSTIGQFGNLVSLAPGLNTTRLDVLALLESQGPAKLLPKRGTIDPKATAIIDRARKLGWEKVTLPARQGDTALSLHVDASGRFVFQRRLAEGLKERVICDGERMLHLYEDLGLVGKRSVSRFHRAALRGMVPWFVAPAKDLRVGCDVKFIDDHSIAIVPLADENAEEKPDTSPNYVLLVFAKDGRLQERQLIDGKTNKPVRRVHYAADGLVTVFDKDGKEIGKREWKRSASKTPNVKPKLDDYVVLSMPHRSPAGFLKADQQQLANQSQFAAMDEESCLQLLGSYHATADVSMMNNLLNQRYFGKEDHRLGLYVLQASVHQQTGLANPAAQLMTKHPSSMLAEYLSQHFQWSQTGNTNQDFVISKSGDGFIQRLASARNLYVRWQTKRAIQNRSATEIRAERERSLEELQNLDSSGFAWTLLKIMQKADAAPTSLPDYIAAAEQFAEKPGLKGQARFQAAIWRSEAGETESAVNELDAISGELLEAGLMPPISESVRECYVNHDGLKAWMNYATTLQARLLKEKNRYLALQLGIRVKRIKADAFAEKLIAKALQGLDAKKEPYSALLATGYLLQQKEYAQAEEHLAPLLEMEGWSESPSIWRKASEIASLKKEEALAVARLERALDLEYDALPDMINLQAIRTQYSAVLSRIQALAGNADKEDDLMRRAIRLADRWRVLDPDDTSACQAAARIAGLLGDEELAWDYLTTPLADKPNESAPWVALAKVMAQQQKIDWADRAYRQAFDAEATNAQILWDHAELMRKHQREEDAQELYEKLAHETWQPRFASLKSQANGRLRELQKTPIDVPSEKDE